MLSLSNFTQRTPVAMAVWSLSCFFVSASTSPWVSAVYPSLGPGWHAVVSVCQRLGSCFLLDFLQGTQLSNDGYLKPRESAALVREQKGECLPH